MAVKTSEIRSRIAQAAIDSGWKQSRRVFELYPDFELRDLNHKGFAVGVVRTSIDANGKQNRNSGMYAHTETLVRYMYRLRTDNMINDYDLALDAEAELIEGILENYNRADGLTLHVVSARRDVKLFDDNMPFLLGEVLFSAHHTLALS